MDTAAAERREGAMRTRIPFGYQIVNGKAIPHPVEAPKVRSFFDFYLSGLSIKQSGALAEIHLTPSPLKHILLNPIYGGGDSFYPSLVPDETSQQAIRRVATRSKPHKKTKKRQFLPVDTEFVFSRATSSPHTSVQELLQNIFDRIVPVRDASPETLSDYMNGLTASDYMSGAFDFAPDLTVMPLREST